MPTNFVNFFKSFLFRVNWPSNLYPSDFFDILITTLFIYSIFIFLRRTRTYLIFYGLAITFGLYFLASTFNLYLTFLTLRYIVGFSLVIFAVIFQSEIRKYLELVGLIGARQIKVGLLAPKSPSTTEIIQACVQMAQSKIGALIVIQGKDNIDPFIEGGIPLDGVISEEVLSSIFDPHSGGHDGALIVTSNRISKFGSHLPLSTNFKEIGKRGTRHSAALGLSENSDALCIVISEEKGTISIAKDGKLKTLSEYTDLEKEFNKYIKLKFASPPRDIFSHVFRHNFSLKLGAIATAVLVWSLTAYQAGIIEKTFTAKLIVTDIPENILIEDYSPKEIKVTLRGRGEATFKNIHQSNYIVEFNASNINGGVEKNILTRKNFDVPSNLTLVNFTPETFLITSKKYYNAKVKVTAKTTGKSNPNLKISSIEVTPDQVNVRIPDFMEPPSEIFTETVDISNQTESVIVPVKLILPEDILLLDDNEKVNVALTVEK